jgi:hypothetical protein
MYEEFLCHKSKASGPLKEVIENKWWKKLVLCMISPQDMSAVCAWVSHHVWYCGASLPSCPPDLCIINFCLFQWMKAWVVVTSRLQQSASNLEEFGRLCMRLLPEILEKMCTCWKNHVTAVWQHFEGCDFWNILVFPFATCGSSPVSFWSAIKLFDSRVLTPVIVEFQSKYPV